MRRLWCRLRGHRWEDHHALSWTPGIIQWCPRCGDTRTTLAAEVAAAWRERRL